MLNFYWVDYLNREKDIQFEKDCNDINTSILTGD